MGHHTRESVEIRSVCARFAINHGPGELLVATLFGGMRETYPV
jgi:hypothetical protein